VNGVPAEVRTLAERLLADGYVADAPLAAAMHLARTIGRALLLEGEPGVGKSEAARAYAHVTGARFVRLQCYEGIDASQALYDWDYGKQLLAIRRAEAAGTPPPSLYADEFLLRRPLLEALEGTRDEPVVLLVDEIDRADDEFEAFLLELLQDFAVTIPELGTVRAARRPVVFLTSNRTRELHDALKRRCLYHWVAVPTIEQERTILRLRAPEVDEALRDAVARAVARLRALELRKRPGTAEGIDWARSLAALGAASLDAAAFDLTIGSVVKHADDLETVRARRAELIA
jgi:MoxR-like ATPase